MSDPESSAGLRRVFYVSRSHATPQALGELLESARRRNAACGLTGALVYSGGHFAQVLEGPAEAVDETMSRIEADDRHDRVRRLLDQPLPERRFGRWTMALVDAPGADDVLQDVLAQAEVGHERALRLLDRLFADPPADAD